ncbi:hypothetical protein B0A48_12641 [Cryoendolithus antarcticus]|uniref:J domain-containing protein n=1 Tax=Cryoendolithus antarcticus TaxID=1507870 RepID=A0A1V8SQZ9_9PEZI|nr:hypothetical protein B0A48_12641 [Cryoendolithus antarcticus]
MSHGTFLTDLRALIAADVAASNALQTRIAQLEDDLAAGKSLPDKKVDLMERSNKDIVRDLVARLESIEGSANLTATDREMMQALNARLAVCDLLAMRLAKLRDLEFQARGTQEFLEVEALPASRSKSKSTAKPHEEDVEPLLRPATPEDRNAKQAEEDEGADEELPTSHDTAEDDEEVQAESDEEAEPDKSTWPLLYQIIDVDPRTEDGDFKQACDLSLKRLARKNNPKFLPNDADASRRWAAVIKAHETLIDPERKRFYDMRNKTPVDLEGFDLSSLRIE